MLLLAGLSVSRSRKIRTRGFNQTIVSMRAIGEHPFRILKCQFGYIKVRYRGLDKDITQLYTLFALDNLSSNGEIPR